MSDCRAYELVTPPFKGGTPAFWTFHKPPPISPDGNKMLGITFGGFGETENDENNGLEFGAVFEFSRTPSGWVTEALEPPATLSARSLLVTPDATFERSLWQLSAQAEPETELIEPTTIPNKLAIREGHGKEAHFEPVGPEMPIESANERLSGFVAIRSESADLKHVVFAIRGAKSHRWPGDETEPGPFSLYEYSGTHNTEPTLVGVANEGRLHGSPHVNEGAQLESTCGTSLGAPRGAGSTFNALNRSGTVAYFTAFACEGAQPEVDELFARVNAERTVAISEPSPAQCKECKVPATAELGRRSAVFEGASEDGSRAFFLSQQELLPGAHETSLFEYDSNHEAEGSSVSLIAPEVLGVARVSDDGSHVFFASTQSLPAAPDSSLAPGQREPTAGQPNLYGLDTETHELEFIATLPGAEDARLWAQADAERRIDTTPTGGFVVFSCEDPLTEDDHATVSQLFEYDGSTHEAVRISRGQVSAAFPLGYGDDGDTTNSSEVPRLVRSPQQQNVTAVYEYASELSVAANGSAVFSSKDALSPGTSQGQENVYEFTGGNVYLISAGNEVVVLPIPEGEDSRLQGINATGTDVFFFSTNQLVPQAVDSQADWYDAREGGGLPGPIQTPGCSGDACQGPVSAAPVFGAPSSATFSGSGNLAPPSPTTAPKKVVVKCSKGKRLSHGKCVKSKTKKKARSKKAGKSNRRAGR